VAADIHHVQAGMLVVEPEGIEEVTGQALAGDVLPGQAGAGNLDIVGRQERPLHLRRRLQVADHVGVDSGNLGVERGEFLVGLLQAVAGDGEFLVGDHQFLVLRDCIFEGRDEQVEHLLTAGLHPKLLAGERHLEHRRGRIVGRLQRRLEQRVHPR